MRFFGYTSTSLIRSTAESFAFSNEKSKRVCFHINWEDARDHYYMNAGAFDEEEEILLYDGVVFRVHSVLDEQYQGY